MRKLLLLSLLFVGCAAQRRAMLERQASFDFNCPIEKVHVTSTGIEELAFHVNVCGVDRLYHSGAQDDPLWHPQQVSCPVCDASSALAPAGQPASTTPKP